MPKISCMKTDCAHNEYLMCCADSIRIDPSCGCQSFLDRTKAERREVEVRLYPFSMETPVVFIIRSATCQIGAEAKAAGFSYEKEPPTGTFFGGWLRAGQKMEYVWLRRAAFSDFEGVLAELEKQGSYVVKNFISEEEKRTWEKDKTYYDLGKAERLRRLQDLQPPRPPAILKGGKWNGKIYGYPGKETVYISGEQRKISPQQADEIRKYRKRKDEYETQYRFLLRDYPS